MKTKLSPEYEEEVCIEGGRALNRLAGEVVESPSLEAFQIPGCVLVLPALGDPALATKLDWMISSNS